MPGKIDHPRIVGRERERGILRDALKAALDGHGQTIFLLGEDGIGKSWLALEAARSGRSMDMLTLRGRASRIGPWVALRPLAEALAGFPRAAPDHAGQGPRRELLEWSAQSPVVLGEQILRLVADTGRACLLVLEDLHDADPLTLAVVEYLADNLGGQAMALLATVCHEPGPSCDLAHLLAQRHSATLLPLAGFEPREVRLLVASHLKVDPADVPDEAVERLWRDSCGNPLLARELLRGEVGTGRLVADDRGCRFDGRIPVEIPDAVGRRLAQRAARFGPAGQRLLLTAAAIGERFPLSVLQRVLRVSEHGVRAHLRAALTNGLIVADPQDDDWYVFRNPMTVAALRAQQIPADRALVAARAASAVRELYPGLPGEWCRFTAEMMVSAGDPAQAAQQLTQAGARAMTAGSADVAADLLERAWALLDDTADADLRARVLADLLLALAASGRVERGLQAGEAMEGLLDAGTDAATMATLHARLAWLAHVGGRYAVAIDQVREARTLLGTEVTGRESAPVDAIEALLTTHLPTRAEQVADRAESAGCPTCVCQAWLARGLLARSWDTGDPADCFGRAHTLAAQNRLPLWRLYATYLLGEEEWLTTGDVQALRRAEARARRMGADAVHHLVIARCALDHVLRGDYAGGDRLADSHLATARRLGLTDAVRELQAVRAVAAAHQSVRPTSRQLPLDGSRTPLVIGLADAVCSLLEENRDRALRELAEAAARRNEQPVSLPLAGQHGLALLLRVLARDGRPSRPDVPRDPASRWRWDNQFTLLARAVLLGRRGRGKEAMAAVEEAGEVAHAYPMARNLGLRLVSEAAHADRWGEPATWLRTAETYFRDAAVPAVARTCRSMLRATGVVVPHQRSVAGVPGRLRQMGVTEREYDVLRLLADRLDNRSIAGVLFISPRTVEKHVASLMRKTERPRRAALSAYAAQVRQGEP
ncbi:AAA family ATPase [Nonomuraea sp. NPDC050643]|uniref:ATP-binding protein n=1 Tax=Nonomuraea sp. NPDC050643 TaxID=3155660 RepID=UPI00340ACDEC